MTQESASMSIRIRRVDPDGEEARTFRQHLHRLGDPFYTGKPRTRVPLPEGSVAIIVEKPAEDDPNPAMVQMGAVAIKPLKAGEPTAAGLPLGNRCAEIKRMVVLPEFQGSGAAQELLRAVEAIGRTELGAQCIVVETLHTLVSAVRFYTKSGYQKRDMYGLYDPEHSVFFEKWL